MSLFSRKAYDKLTAMTGEKVGWSCSLVSYSHFLTDRAQYIKANPLCFQCARARARANDAINYAQ